MIEVLLQSSPDYVSREELGEKIWDGRFVTDFTINQTINSLRKKLGDSNKSIIMTVPRQGYAIDKNFIEILTDKITENIDPAIERQTTKNDVSQQKKKNAMHLKNKCIRIFIMLILFLACGSVGVGLAAISGLNNKISTVYVNSVKYSLHDSIVEYDSGEKKIICSLLKEASHDGEVFYTGKTACHPA